MNGLYLSFLLGEIREQLLGQRIRNLFQANRLIYLVLSDGELSVSFYPEAMGLFYRQLKTKSAEGEPKFKYLKGSIIEDVVQDELNPAISLKLRAYQQISLLVSFVRNHQDFKVVKEDGRIDSLFRSTREVRRSKLLPAAVDAKMLAQFMADANSAKGLIDNIQGIDRFLAQEIVQDSTCFKKLLEAFKTKSYTVNVVSTRPLRLSLFQQSAHGFKTFNDAFEFSIQSHLENIQADEKERKIRSELKRLSVLKSELESEMHEAYKADSFRIIGQTILAHVGDIKRGDAKAVLANPYTPAEKIEIRLDTKLSPEANAQDYFARYKKLKKKLPPLVNRFKKIESQIEKLEQGFLEITERPVSSRKKGKEDIPEHFRRFFTKGQFEVLVGKDAKTNDELTFKYARSFDIFFHARGIGGSHTVLRTAKKKPSKYDLYEAAAIAAYYSKARNARKVPVSYTERKYLKKNKKGPPGMVIMMREEVIFVDPAIPRETYK